MSSFPQFFLMDPADHFYDLAFEDITGETLMPIRKASGEFEMGMSQSCILLADHDGAETLVMDLRARGFQGPLVILRKNKETRRAAFLIDLGADDDLLLPVTLAELRARIDAIRRRSQESSGTSSEICGIRIFSDGRLPETKGQNIPLSPHESQILEQLLRNAGRFITRSALYDSLYGLSNRAPSDSVIEVHICNIRRKLRAVLPGLEKRLETSRGRGYQFI